MRRPSFFLLPLFFALPLSAQAWDLRFEVPFPQGQSLPQTAVGGTLNLAVSGKLDTGNGALFTVSHRLFRVGPVLRLDWGGELGQLTADGVVDVVDDGTNAQHKSNLKQTGIGLCLNAQISVPLLGIGGEIGAIQRFQRYEYTTNVGEQSDTISRLWLRVGVRYKLNLLVASPYITASYQQPINKDNPVNIGLGTILEDIPALLNAQGSGQEFQRMWTFGIGIMF
jgi:hypothetical protein